MRLDARKIRWRLARYRALIGFYLVAMAQFLSPAAAADPASKIDPPAWSHTHSQQELQAYGIQARAEAPEKKQAIARVLRRQRLEQGAPPDSPSGWPSRRPR